MAFTVTDLGEAVTGYGTSVTLSSFTPTANRLMIACVTVYSETTIDSITGHGTWELIDSGTAGAGFGRYRQNIYALKTGGSPSASAVTANYTPTGGGDTGGLRIVEIDGADISGTATQAIIQNHYAADYVGSTPATLTGTLSAFASATNLTIIFAHELAGHTDPESGYTEIAGNKIEVMYKTGEDTTPSVDYNASGGGGYYPGMHSLEVKEAAGGDTNPPNFNPGAGPTVTVSTNTGHTISSTIDENGTIYGVRLADGATAPTSAQVKAGNDSTDSAAPEAKSVSASSGVSADLVFSTGSLSTAYDYYIVAEDSSGNLQATPTLVEATTEAGTISITGGVLQYGQPFTFTYTGIASVSTPITIGPDSQGNTLDVAITDNGDGTGSGTMPALPSSGSSALILIENGLTVTATE